MEYADEELREIARFAQKINEETENIGARRLYTIMERIVADLSFDAPDMSAESVRIDRDYVAAALQDVQEDRDLTRYIL